MTAEPGLASGSAACLVAIGAIPGAWLRLRIVNHLAPSLGQRQLRLRYPGTPGNNWATLLLNVVAAGMLGLCAALLHRQPSPALALLLGTGFLGSLSSFSTFMVDLAVLLSAGQRGEALLLLGSSVSGGLLATSAGFAVGTMF